MTSKAAFPLCNRLTEGLSFLTVDELTRLLKLLPIKALPSRKAKFVEAIADYLLGPGLKVQWELLNELQQAAVAEALYRPDGRHDAETFRTKYGDSPDWPSQDRYIYGSEQSAALLDLFFYRIGNYGPRVILPHDLGQQLKAFVPAPPPFEITTLDNLPETFAVRRQRYDYQKKQRVITTKEIPLQHRQMEQAALQDLNSILRLVQQGKISVSDKTLMPSQASLKAIAPLLYEGDYYSDGDEFEEDFHDPIGGIRPFAWVMILQAGKLASPSGKKLQLTKAGLKALGGDPGQTIQVLWKQWQKTTLLDELRRIDNIKGQTGKGKRGLTAVSGRRSQIIEALSSCPTNQWVEVDSFIRSMILNRQIFPVSRSPHNLYILEQGYGYLSCNQDDWSILQDSYLKCFLFEYAATLGLLDLAYIPPYSASQEKLSQQWGTDDLSFLSRYDGLVYFRFTPLGKFCLGLSDQYSTPNITSQTELQIQRNGSIINLGSPLSPLETQLLESFAQLNLDGSWRLDRKQALTATAAGQSLDDFYNFLLQACPEPLPAATEAFFQDCRHRTESLQDKGLVRLIECASPDLAQQIAQDPHLKKCCRLAGDRHLFVYLKQEARFLKGLQKLGYSLNLAES